MKHALTYILVFVYLISVRHSTLMSQQDRSQLDSLLIALHENQSVDSHLPILWKLSDQYLTLKNDSAKLYVETGLKQAQVLSDSLWIAKFTLQLGEVLYQSDEYEKAVRHSERALSIFQRLNLTSEIAKSHYEIGKSLIFTRELSKADSHFQKSIEICERNEDIENLAFAYCYYAFHLYYQSDFKQALELYTKSQGFFEQLNGRHLSMIAENANIVGSIHFFLGDMFRSMESFRESAKNFRRDGNQGGVAYALNNIALINQEVEYFDEAIALHLEALKIRREIKDSMKITYSLYDIGEFYKKQNQNDKALEAYTEGLEICKAVQDNYFINKFLAAIAETYADKGEMATARTYFEQTKKTDPPLIELKLIATKLLILEKRWREAIQSALVAIENADKYNLVKMKSEAVGYLLESYAALGEYQKAYEYGLVKHALTDSLNSDKNAKLTRRLAFEFETERKEASLKNLEKQSELQQSQIKNQRYLLYVFVLLGLLAIMAAVGFYFLSRKNKQLAAKETQLRNSTLNLFANISHELRTPLSIIRIPLEQLQKGLYKGDIHHTRKTMLANVQRLTDLVDQILDIARTKENQLQLNLEYEDPLEFLRVFIGQFGSYANYKNLSLELKIPTISLSIYYDEEIWSKILNNLINNALKFTEKGSVRIEFKYRKEQVEFKINDSGNGIPAEHLPHIFNRYYRNPLENHQNFTGGLGLSLVKELIDLYKGTIEVESEVSKGTTFIIQLPHKVRFKNEDIPTEFEILNFSQTPPISDAKPDAPNSLPIAANPIFTKSQNDNENLKKILIIEDNVELNEMISKYLSEQYIVYQAFDGVEGFEVAQKVIPNLILTDVMMPRMDGIDLAQKLHTSPETSHIPLIIISALKDEFLDKTFWKAGVVDFVQKPLDMERLFLKINSLINSREEFKSLIQKNGWIELTSDVPVADGDKDFLERLQNVLIENMDQEDFAIDKLSQLMLVSRMQLFRKVKSLTGMTPSKFIQKIKMQYAYELLQNGKIENVTEVAASIGYSNLSFFSRKFKEIHGVNATDVIKGR